MAPAFPPRSSWLGLAAACALGLALPAAPGARVAAQPAGAWASSADPRLLLPDLRSLPPSDLTVDTKSRPGRRLLRLTNTVWNAGAGPLELRGQLVGAGNEVRVTQRVVARDGEAEERPVGRFVYHPSHKHTHFQDFSEYEVWTLTPDSRLERRLATSDKLGYCLWDDDPVATGRPGPPGSREYTWEGCTPERQGLSVGWGDTYAQDLQGQFVDVTGLKDGHYALRTAADANGLIRELDEANNDAVLHFTLRGNRVEVEKG